MAQPTSSNAAAPAAQGKTPGVTPMGQSPAGVAGGQRPSMQGVQQTPDTAPAEPVLFDDLDPVLLARMYPNAKSGEEARSHAMEAGRQAHAHGHKLVAAQQEPTLPLER